MHHRELYQTLVFESWDDLESFYSKRGIGWDGWIFRGHRQAEWCLKTTLERSMARLQVPLMEAPEVEEGFIRRFVRHMHLYPNEITISAPNFMETLALIQHHGGPTRLLDWSYSFFVAAYFALEAAFPKTSCAVWALDADWWKKRARSLFPKEVQELLRKDKNAKAEKTAKAMLRHKPPLRTIHPMNAFRLSERHVYQQSVFVTPCDITVPFMENLGEIADPSSADHMMKIEIVCTQELLKTSLERLHRMNINRATLFPGLDGFAKQLEHTLVLPRSRAVD